MYFLVTFQAFSLNDDPKPSASDAALSNAMIYFEKADFDNAVLQLEAVVDNFSGTKLLIKLSFILEEPHLSMEIMIKRLFIYLKGF